MSLPFTKCQGAGNDFVLLHQVDPTLDLSLLARFLCDRRRGIGADGLLLIGPSQVAHYQMRIFNADGSEPAMCGNGAMCAALYIDQCLTPFTELTLETLRGVVRFTKKEGTLSLQLPLPIVLHFPHPQLQCYVVDTGVPHAVVWVEDLEGIDVQRLGSALRYDPQFAPHGVNVNFARLLPEGRIQVRTYERGVEGETLSCGTGAMAVACVASRLYSLPSPIQVETLGSPLFPHQIDCLEEGIAMRSAAEMVYRGEITTRWFALCQGSACSLGRDTV